MSHQETDMLLYTERLLQGLKLRVGKTRPHPDDRSSSGVSTVVSSRVVSSIEVSCSGEGGLYVGRVDGVKGFLNTHSREGEVLGCRQALRREPELGGGRFLSGTEDGS